MTDMGTKLASAVCSTYGRPTLLAEAIKCFLDQDYPNKELIIINDQGEFPIELIGDFPEIRLYNVAQRFPSLGAKRQFGKSLVQVTHVEV